MRIAQGEDAATITYADGCQGAGCAWARAERVRATVASGCSRVVITFRDRGEIHKWLHVKARLVSEQCAGSPRYPKCAGAIGKSPKRRLVGLPAGDAWYGAGVALEGLALDAAFEGRPFSQRALLAVGGAGNDTDGRSVSTGDEEQQDAADDDKEPLAAAYQSDEEDEDVDDIDEPIDLACSVFKVRVMPAGAAAYEFSLFLSSSRGLRVLATTERDSMCRRTCSCTRVTVCARTRRSRRSATTATARG